MSRGNETSMNGMKSIILINIVLLLLVIIGVVGVFTPWFHFTLGSAMDSMVNGDSFLGNPSVTGFQTWAGIPVLCLLFLEAVSVFVKHKNFIWLPFVIPTLVLLLPIILIILFDASTASQLVAQRGFDGKYILNAKFDYGIYLTVLSAFLMLIVTFVKMRQLEKKSAFPILPEVIPEALSPDGSMGIGVIEAVSVLTSESQSDPIIDISVPNEDNSLPNDYAFDKSDELNSKDSNSDNDLLRSKKFKWITIALSSLVVMLMLAILLFIYSNYFGKKSDPEKVLAEKARLEKIISTVNKDIATKNYDGALLNIGKIIWVYEAIENVEYAKLFEKQRDNLFKTVQDLRNLQTGEQHESSIPLYSASVSVDRAYVYSQPEYSARTSRYLTYGQFVSVLKISDNFLYISYLHNEEYLNGWVLKSEFANSENMEHNSRTFDYGEGDYGESVPPPPEKKYEETITLASAYNHKDKNWNLYFDNDGTVQFRTETSKTPYQGTWKMSKLVITIEIPSFTQTAWKFKVLNNGLYDNSGMLVWLVSQR